jgi:arginine utilization regulatory protein
MNIHPLKAVEENKLREDLFYRLNVLTFELTPLRERPEDILYLTGKFIGDFSRQLGKQEAGLNQDVEGVFLNHPWPGNIRELKHTIEYMMNVYEGEGLSKDDLPALLRKTAEKMIDVQSNFSLKENLKRYEKGLIERAMEESGGNIQKAARLLGIPRQTLQYKLKK